ncbi:MAG: type IX secretion system sortase PorU [Paraprevotella sp.]|nr:type IX secretion system sortase PorU [Paraprevotella sp.]
MRMLRIILVVLLAVGAGRLSSQSITRLDWDVLRIDSAVPCYTEVVPLGERSGDYEYEVRIEYPEYTPVSVAERDVLKRLAPALPESPEIRSAVGVSRKEGFIDLSFIPVVLRKGVYYKLLSCKITIHRTLRPRPRAASVLEAREAYAAESVLKSGRWVKIKVTGEGVHMLTRTALQKMGFSNPDRVKLYGYGGHVQDEVLYAGQGRDDLEEVPLYHGGQGLLFYARGLVSWTRPAYNAASRTYISSHLRNTYARYATYFLTEGDSPLAFPKEASSSSVVRNELASFPEHVLYERDEVAWFSGGRRLYDGHNYADGNNQSYRLEVKNPVASEGGALKVDFSVSYAGGTTQVAVKADGVSLGSLSVNKLADYYRAQSTSQVFRLSSVSAAAGGVSVTITTPQGRNARLDYLELSYTRELVMAGSQLAFTHYKTGTSRYTVRAASGQKLSIWRLDGPGRPVTEISSVRDGNDYSVVVDDPTDNYVAVDVNAAYPEPEFVADVANQNLHAVQPVDMVIIVPSSNVFRGQAERLAQAHRDCDGMTVQVVRAEEIYNEFSSGTPDATAYRRFMKMLYDRAASADEAPRYLLLFGDAAWDNRMLSPAWRGVNPDNFLLCYESDHSLSDIRTYVMEDYFGLLDDGEGHSLLTGKVDIGVGRIPVQSEFEAKGVVDKIINYMTNVHAGKWRNTVCVMGDDADGNSHMKYAAAVADEIEAGYPDLNVQRVMWDAYPRVSGITGNSYPMARARVLAQMNEGALMMNYTGHAGPTSLSHEKVVVLNDFLNFTSPNVPLWVTAACDVMPFDSKENSIGESALLNANGAAVAFLGTTRTVYANSNDRMNRAFCRFVFGKDDKGRPYRLGDALRMAKVTLVSTVAELGLDPNIYISNPLEDLSENKLQYALLGDPALRLGTPRYKVVLDNVNGTDMNSGAVVTLSAGSLARFSGHIEDEAGNEVPAFRGVLSTTVYDSKTTVVCLNNEKKGAVEPYTYEAREKVLYSGSDSVRGGRFEIEFSVPVDINYSDRSGRAVFYAINAERTFEANGHSEDFLVGGVGTELAADKEGPRVYAYLNTEDFQNGDVVNATPYFVAFLEDESGINVSGNGIGHNLELMIDGAGGKLYDLSEYYRSEFGDYRKGSVAFSIPQLEAGTHRLKFRVWDVMNNSSSVEMDFVVEPGRSPSLINLICSANPARTETSFSFHYDRPGSTCDFRIEVFDFSGRVLWNHAESGVSTDGYYTVPWGLTTGGGMPLQTGVYLYRAAVSCGGSEETSEVKKIVVLRNK